MGTSLTNAEDFLEVHEQLEQDIRVRHSLSGTLWTSIWQSNFSKIRNLANARLGMFFKFDLLSGQECGCREFVGGRGKPSQVRGPGIPVCRREGRHPM